MTVAPTPAAPQGGADTTVEMFVAGQPRLDAERALDAAGVPLPLQARVAWAEAFPDVSTAVLALRTPSGGYSAGVGLSMYPSRALPGHQIWRVDRVGDAAGAARVATLLAAVVAHARRRRHVLRVEASVFSRQSDFRRAVAHGLTTARFREVPALRTYGHTLVLDLVDEEAMFAALSKQTRRNIRAAARAGVEVRPIDSPEFAGRMEALMRETLARTGGVYTPIDWGGAVRVSAALPDRSRLVGMFRRDADGPDSLLAFSWGMHYGAYAAYDAGASTRNTNVRVTMADSLMWDMLTWARRAGAAWFDFGGVSRPAPGAVDPLAGISDFKRSFSRQVEEVGAEFVSEVTPVRSAVARALGRGARVLQRFGAR